MAERPRQEVYRDLVTTLLDVRYDLATARFDAEIAAALADGRLDEPTARLLTWWQRESLRTLVEHAALTLPPTMIAIEDAAEAAGDEVVTADRAWRRAVGDEATDVDVATATRTQAPPPAESPWSDHDDATPSAGPPPKPAPGQPEPDPPPPPTSLAAHRQRQIVVPLTKLNRTE